MDTDIGVVAHLVKRLQIFFPIWIQTNSIKNPFETVLDANTNWPTDEPKWKKNDYHAEAPQKSVCRTMIQKKLLAHKFACRNAITRTIHLSDGSLAVAK